MNYEGIILRLSTYITTLTVNKNQKEPLFVENVEKAAVLAAFVDGRKSLLWDTGGQCGTVVSAGDLVSGFGGGFESCVALSKLRNLSESPIVHKWG